MGNTPNDLPTPTTRTPADVLLVEDNFILALDTEALLREIGVISVRTAKNVLDALNAITLQPPEFCLLDVNLETEKSFIVADRLRELAIPFAFATGYGDQLTFPPHFANAAIVAKPYAIDDLRHAIVVP